MRAILLVLVTAALAACQAAPAPPPKAEDGAGATMSPIAAEAAALMATGQYQAASERYRQALAGQPDDVSLRFGLGVAYSHLNRRPEAIEQLRWVAQHAGRDGAEYREARRWLRQVGVEVEPAATAATVAAARAAATASDSMPVLPGTGWLTGSSQWPGVNPNSQSFRGEISLTGEDESNRTISRSRPFRLGRQYDFPELQPGRYRLVATLVTGAKHTTFWDQKVVVQADQRTQLVLTPATSKISPDDWPPKESQ